MTTKKAKNVATTKKSATKVATRRKVTTRPAPTQQANPLPWIVALALIGLCAILALSAFEFINAIVAFFAPTQVVAAPMPTQVPVNPTASAAAQTNQSNAPQYPQGSGFEQNAPVVAQFVQPTESFCQLGTTQMANSVVTHSLSWDYTIGRGYMNDELARAIQSGTAYCKTTFSSPVTLYIDAIAAEIYVDGVHVTSGNGIVYTGSVFEFVYRHAGTSNGHAFIQQ